MGEYLTDWVSIVISVCALAVSARVWVAEIWRRRTAGIEVRYETFLVPEKATGPVTRHRIVVVNHGPAVAKGVHLHVEANPNGGVCLITHQAVPDNHRIAMLPTLHAGQRYDVEVTVPDGSWIEGADVYWKDGRRERQFLHTALSPVLVVPALGLPVT